MERETKITHIGENTFTVKTYATAREAQAIQQAYFKGAKVEMVGQEPRFTELNPAVVFEVQQETIRQMVVDMNGSAENILDRCLDGLPSEDFEELIQQLDELVSKKKR